MGHWAIAEENSSFFVLCRYHTTGGCKGWKQLHCAMTRVELDKATEAPRNEKGDAACDVRQSVSRAFQDGISRDGRWKKWGVIVPLREYASICTVLIGATEAWAAVRMIKCGEGVTAMLLTRSRTMFPLRDSARIVAIERTIESPTTRSVACMLPSR
jgi:hypothetical protein